MSRITCKYYVTSSHRTPVKEFVSNLDARARRKFYYAVELLETLGHLLLEPHSKYIGDHIFELRFQAEQGSMRVLYFFFVEQDVILTNAFLKKSNKTPKKEKNIAIERRKEYFLEKLREAV